jgi:hypothetical protein
MGLEEGNDQDRGTGTVEHRKRFERFRGVRNLVW